MASAKMTKLRPIGAHFRELEERLMSLVWTKRNSPMREPVMIQKIKEGERYHMKYGMYTTPDIAM
jgi:hypothetical protein